MIYPTLKRALPRDDYTLELVFGDGEKRIYDFKSNLDHKFYKALKDINLFKQVSVTDGELEWVTGQDFCPHTLYEQSAPMRQEIGNKVSGVSGSGESL